MPVILGNYPIINDGPGTGGFAGNQGGGILGTAQQQQMPDWAQKLGLFSAALKDASAQFSGREDPGALMAWRQGQQQNDIRQQLLGALSSKDPAVRQQGYSAAAMLGIPTDSFQKQQAAQQLPQLLSSMKPSQQTFPSQSGALDNGGQITTAPINFEAPGLNISDAIAQAPPELQAQYAPKLLDQQITEMGHQKRTLTPQEAIAAGFRSGDVVQEDQSGGYSVPKASDIPSQGKLNSELWLKQNDPHLPIDRQTANTSAGRLAFDKSKYAAGLPDENTMHDMATRYVNGDKGVATGMSRNAQMQTAFQNMISQVGRERGLSQAQISQNQQRFAAATKAVQAFDTGKQGDTTRSLNVSVAHLSTLGELGDALNNGDITLVNAAKQKFAEAFGVPAPTNFDAARAIVADEVAKGVIGGQTAQADREALAASLKRERSPQAIKGAIGTFQNLLGGQLHGLRQQYKSSTGMDDFNDKLFPETINVLEKAMPKKGAPPVSAAGLPRLPTASNSGWTVKRRN